MSDITDSKENETKPVDSEKEFIKKEMLKRIRKVSKDRMERQRVHKQDAKERIVMCAKYKLDELFLNHLDLLTLDYIWETALQENDIASVDFPNSLKRLDCNSNRLRKLPNILPNSIETLDCSHNNMHSVTKIFPTELKTLKCGNNVITKLQNLPEKLQILECSRNRLKSLPEFLPSGLITLDVSFNDIQHLPKILPATLRILRCSACNLKELPELPDSLIKLICSGNKLKKLPKLPSALEQLFFPANHIKTLPELPKGLSTLSCGLNKLTVLPLIPPTLANLFCYGNNLIKFPKNLPMFLQISYRGPLGPKHKRNNNYLSISAEEASRHRLRVTPNYQQITNLLKLIYFSLYRVQDLKFCERLNDHSDEFRFRPGNAGYVEVSKANKNKFVDL